jgi:predicted transcriptional regulator
MSAPSIKLQLSHEERRALEDLAMQEMRRPSDMLRWILNEEVKRRQTKHNGAVTNLTGTHGAVAAIAG